MVFIRLILFGAAVSLLSGCQISYIVKNGYEQSKILAKRESLEKVLRKKSVPDEIKRKLQLAVEAKVFAEKHLHLAATKNYSSYVDLERPYVSWIVQAAKEYELTAHLWHFPLVGSLPYKGYFTKAEAEKEASNFDENEYDTYIRGVTAYSTLGWFKDPLLNTMMNYSDSDLVELIIHESVHATLYIKSEAEFNERLASYVGQLGAQKFFLAKEGADSPTVKKIKLEREDQEKFSVFLSAEIKSLEAWYADNKDKITPEQKAERLKKIQQAYQAELLPQLKTPNLNKVLSGELNNAILVGLKTYNMDLTDFEKLYDKLGQDIGAFIKFCKDLEDQKDPAKSLKDSLARADSPARLFGVRQ